MVNSERASEANLYIKYQYKFQDTDTLWMNEKTYYSGLLLIL